MCKWSRRRSTGERVSVAIQNVMSTVQNCWFLSINTTPYGLSKKWMKISCRYAAGASEIGYYWIQTCNTKLIVFGSQQMTWKLYESHLSLLRKDISPVQSAKDLGVILDPNLTFDTHYDHSVRMSECIARLAQINHDVKHCLDKNT